MRKNFNHFNHKVHQAFTLIELLVVISVIGVLATLVVANLNSARERARDAQRKSDLHNLQMALRLYYNDHGSYPTSTASYGITGVTWGGTWISGSTTYMSLVPKDPLPDQSYRYTQADADNYTLEACLENKSDGTATGAWCTSGKEVLAKP